MARGGWRQVAGLCVLLAALAAPAGEIDSALARIRAVGREGMGNPEAAAAWKELSRRGPDDMPAILAGMDGASPTAANWIRAAADAVAERAVADGRPLPAARLETFLKDTSHNPAARNIAYEWLTRIDASTPGRLLPGMLRDPSPELRRDAVALVMREAKGLQAAGKKQEAIAAWRKAFDGALDKDQVDNSVKALADLGVTVDVAAHFGFIRHWHLASPFPNPQGRDFNTIYPPEKGVDLAATCAGKNGAVVRWKPHTTNDAFGAVDLNKVLGKEKGTIAYAYAIVDSPREQPIEVHAGSVNAIKVFLNGKEICARDEYHHGIDIDQHIGKGVLKAGRNEVLLKVCQNEQDEAWAQAWLFQARLCDASGAAVPFHQKKDPPDKSK
jgi:hypothetical protein